MRLSFFWSIIIITILVSLVGFWYYQRNVYSKETLKLEILGPENPQAFDEVEYIVKYKNNGDITLEDVRLTFEYPKFSLLPEGEQNIQTKTLEDIYPGQERTISFKARLVGKVGATHKARAVLSYRPKNLKARYESETSYTSTISSVPLKLELDIPTRIDSGKTFSFWINYFSSSDYPISDLRISMDYPAGFNYVLSQPKGLADNEWAIPVLNKAEGDRVEVQGHLQGEMNDQKTFRAVLGKVIGGEFVPLLESIRGVIIAKPSLYISQTINGSQDYIARPGDRLHYEIYFRNIGEEPLTDLFLAVRLDGRPFDLESLRTDTGSFKPGDNSITWDWQTFSGLRFLGAGEEGMVDFWINLKDDWPILGAGDKNFSIRDIVSLAQSRTEFNYKVAAKLVLSQTAYFKDEIFGNTGPIPPDVGKTTTYTVVWQAKSLYNDVTGAKVKALLPKNVELTGKVFPEEASLTFDSESREVVWDIGDLAAQGPEGGGERSVAFQIALTPTSADKGKIVKLVDKAIISGTDTWTQSHLEEEHPAIDTTLPNDITVSTDQGYVGGKPEEPMTNDQ